MTELSTKPYLIRALYEWCGDCGYTPYLAVMTDERTIVPREFVKNGEIVLNVSPLATHRFNISNELVTFQARFNGIARDISIPIENVVSIYARETGHGMAFDVPKQPAYNDAGIDSARGHSAEAPPVPARPALMAVPTGGETGAEASSEERASLVDEAPNQSPPDGDPPPPPPSGRPQLKRIK